MNAIIGCVSTGICRCCITVTWTGYTRAIAGVSAPTPTAEVNICPVVSHGTSRIAYIVEVESTVVYRSTGLIVLGNRGRRSDRSPPQPPCRWVIGAPIIVVISKVPLADFDSCTAILITHGISREIAIVSRSINSGYAYTDYEDDADYKPNGPYVLANGIQKSRHFSSPPLTAITSAFER